MDLSKICHIVGKPGLYQLVSQGKGSTIFESLTDKKRMPFFQIDKISSLEEIAMFTHERDVPLVEIFRAIFQKEEGGKCITAAEPEAKIKAYFKEILPDYDEERVYVSHIKKLFTWYNLLQENGFLDLEPSPYEKERNKIEEEEKKKA